jgi:hypothetical protein
MSDYIDPSALAKIAATSFLGGVVLVVAYTVVVVGLRRRAYAQADGGSGAAFTGAAALAGLICVAGVVAGLYATFHK